MFRKWIDESHREDWEKKFDNKEVVSVRDWMADLMLMLIPVVNIIMLFVWAFSSKEMTHANKVNWARASIIVLTALVFAVAVGFGIHSLMMNSINN